MFYRENIMSQPKYYKFDPKKDITAYEIAQLLPFLIAEWKDANGPTVIISQKKVSAELIAQISELNPDLTHHFSESQSS